MKLSNSIYFIDQTSEGEHHMVFNAALIEIWSKIYPETHIKYWGVHSSQIAVNKLLSKQVQQKVQYNIIRYIPSPTKYKLIKLFFFILKELKRYLNFCTIFIKSSKQDIICLSITTFSSFFVFKLLSFFFNRDIYAVLHGDIDFIYKSTNRYQKINALTYKMIFLLKNKQFKYIVLNKICKKELVKDNYLNFDEVIEMNHPYFFKNNTTKQINFKKPIIFAHNGSMEVERKNSHFIFFIAKQLKEPVIQNDIAFKSIGLANKQIDAYKNEFVELELGTNNGILPPYLPRETYEIELIKVHFLLFFFPINEYIFRASGAVIDSIAFEKPIIALRHPFFENLFYQGGDIGYICDTLEEMIDLIKNIYLNKNDHFERYQTQVYNLSKLKIKFSIETIAKEVSLKILN